MLVMHHVLPIHSRIKGNMYILISYIKCFWSYYKNPIFNPYITSWIVFRPPQIGLFYTFAQYIRLVCQVLYVDKWSMCV